MCDRRSEGHDAMEAPSSMNSPEAELSPGSIRQMLTAFVGSQALLCGIEQGVFDARDGGG
jgi:hypothetical protein